MLCCFAAGTKEPALSDLLPCVEFEPEGPAEGSVLWLHGLGASGHDFEDIVPLLGRPRTRFVFPHAPQRAVTINMGLIMPAWYDILSLGSRALEDERGIRASAALIEALIAREEQRGVPSSRTILAGFSQGGALALFVGTRYARPLLGLMVFSGYELLAATREAEASPANRATPMLFCHGTQDPLVPIEGGRRAFEAFAAPGRDAEWHEFPMAHQMCMQEIERIRDWLETRFVGVPGPAPAP